jgi:hypothetical protein
MRWRVLTLVLLLAAYAAPAFGQGPSYVQDPPKLGQSERALIRRNVGIAEDAEAAEDLEALKSKPRIWLRAEYLLWWIKPANFPPLVTTGPYTDPRPGALDSLGTSVLFGQPGMDFQDRSGGRFAIGGWLGEDELWALEARYFFLKGRSIGQRFESPGAPVLATPFFNLATNTADSSLSTFPGVMGGSITVDAPSFLHGAEANLSAVLARNEQFRFDLTGGFRYLYLREGLHINSNSLVELAPQFQGLGIPFDGNTIAVSDRFDASNHFYGGQLGTRVELHHKRWTIDFDARVALGVSHQVVAITGSTNIDTQPATAANGGLLAVSSNSGRFTQNSFAVVPEVGVMLKLQLTERLQLFGGYSFLYWSRVARPGDQIDANVNPNLVPTSMTFGTAGGPSRPGFSFRQTDFFAHGANFGLEFRY